MYTFLISIFLIALIMVFCLWFFKAFKGKMVPKEMYNQDLSDNNVIITGSSDGIGFETARILASLSANIIFACRNEKKTLQKIKIIENEISHKKLSKKPKLIFVKCDLSDLESVRSFCKKSRNIFSKIHILINNAGIGTQDGTTKQGFELKYGVNHLSHFLLTNLLLDLIVKANGRIINTSSRSNVFMKKAYMTVPYKGDILKNRVAYYKRSKVFNIMFTKMLHFSLLERKKKIPIVSFHPGIVKTKIFKYASLMSKILLKILSPFLKTSFEGAQTLIFLSLLKRNELYKKSGEHFANCDVVKGAWHVWSGCNDKKNQKYMWDISEQHLQQTFS